MLTSLRSLLCATKLSQPRKHFWMAFGTLVVVKVLWVLCNAIHVHLDSYNYLECILHFEYPPFYALFAKTLTSIWPNLYFVAVVQAVVFALCAAYFIDAVAPSKRVFFVLTAVLAIEPFSAFYAGSIMSEALFIPLLMVWLALLYKQLQQPGNWMLPLLLGLLAGVLYGIRYATLIMALYPVVLWVGQKAHRKHSWKYLLVFVVGFQLVLVPVRLAFNNAFDTWRINGLSGALLWNNASIFYPESEVKVHPNNDFERYLQQQPFHYDVALALRNRQIWNEDATMRSYMQYKGHHNFEYRPELSDELGATGLRIIKEFPLRYFTDFVGPNFAQLYVRDDVVNANRYGHHLATKFNYHGATHVRYYAVWWWSYTVLLLAMFGVYMVRRKQLRNAVGGMLLGAMGWYMLLLPIAAVVILRYYLSFSPVILVTAVLIGAALWPRSS